MTPDPLSIAQGEHGIVRVFTAQLDSDQRQHLLDDSTTALRALLGAPGLNADMVSVVQVADLGDLGLGGYLAAGHDVPEAALHPDAARLHTLTGTVLVVSSGALSATGGPLRPAPGIAFFGIYLSADAAPASLWPAAVAAEGINTTPASAPRSAPGKIVPAGPIVILAVLIVTVLIWWLA